MKYFGGIDAGSTYVKTVLMDNNFRLVGHKIARTGVHACETAQKLMTELYRELGIDQPDVCFVTATGYSRRIIDFAHNTVTEIKAHAAGALWETPDEANIRTIIDIGGQDSKVISLDVNGETKNFVMNDKCAAGTGRFIEALARTLEISLDETGSIALKSKSPCQINSLCVVFAESEVISLLARGKDLADVIAGIHESLSKRICGMARKIHFEKDILLTGGGALNPGLVSAFEDELAMDVYVGKNPQLNGAIGAALISREKSTGLSWKEEAARTIRMSQHLF